MSKIEIPPCGLVVIECRETAELLGQLKGDCSKFYLVIAGHVRWDGGDRRYMVGPDTVCHIPAGQPHSQESLPGNQVLAYAIHYRPGLLSPAVGSQLAALGIIPLDLARTSVHQARVVRSIFQEMLFEQSGRQEGWETVLQSRLMDLAVRFLRLARRRSRNQFPMFEPGSDSADRVARYALRLKSHFFRQENVN